MGFHVNTMVVPWVFMAFGFHGTDCHSIHENTIWPCHGRSHATVNGLVLPCYGAPNTSPNVTVYYCGVPWQCHGACRRAYIAMVPSWAFTAVPWRTAVSMSSVPWHCLDSTMGISNTAHQRILWPAHSRLIPNCSWITVIVDYQSSCFPKILERTAFTWSIWFTLL